MSGYGRTIQREKGNKIESTTITTTTRLLWWRLWEEKRNGVREVREREEVSRWGYTGLSTGNISVYSVVCASFPPVTVLGWSGWDGG
jgi:hypothetical protein